MKKNDSFIECQKGICGGCPRIKGRRITVYNVVTGIHFENSIQIACEEMEIDIVAAKQAVVYCAQLQCVKDETLLNYCSGCILREMFENNPKMSKPDIFIEKREIKYLDEYEWLLDIDNKDKEDIEDIEEAEEGWKLAEICLKKFFVARQ
ncbi:MAG: DUF433 domain-containing protein [bacterium]|nr:DUF433 domain-containing protein [bacterium]